MIRLLANLFRNLFRNPGFRRLLLHLRRAVPDVVAGLSGRVREGLKPKPSASVEIGALILRLEEERSCGATAVTLRGKASLVSGRDGGVILTTERQAKH
ncbi:MAG TPA: hypothetical protein VLA21_12135 [Candidatus Limnocylindria bacterium]|nr:hypothetical protein [Candidatus Limnocylindria bacterium]